MSLKMISITRTLTRTSGPSTLAVDSPELLGVLGVLPHGCSIAPRTPADARDLVAWLQAWIERNDKPSNLWRCAECGSDAVLKEEWVSANGGDPVTDHPILTSDSAGCEKFFCPRCDDYKGEGGFVDAMPDSLADDGLRADWKQVQDERSAAR